MTSRKAILSSPLSMEQLKDVCDEPFSSRLLSSESCIVVTPPLPPGASR